MAHQMLGMIGNMVRQAARPPPPPIDRTLPEQPITKDNLEEYITLGKQFYSMNKSSDFHVAIIGGKGVGKSTLINGICNTREDQEGVAPVGVSNNEPKPYRYPMQETLVLWEMPGAGVGHPSLTYFVDKKLYAFDLLMLVSDRFHRVDFDVARCASHFGRRLVFVRTKADVAVRQILEREKSLKSNIEGPSKTSHKEMEIGEAFKVLRREVEASFREGLRLCGLSDKWNSLQLFIVSGKWYLDKKLYSSLNEDEDEDVYSSVTDEDDDEEEGGPKLDEEQLIFYLTNLLRNRAVRRTRTLKQRTFTAKA